jgi:hypothetical protein
MNECCNTKQDSGKLNTRTQQYKRLERYHTRLFRYSIQTNNDKRIQLVWSSHQAIIPSFPKYSFSRKEKYTINRTTAKRILLTEQQPRTTAKRILLTEQQLKGWKRESEEEQEVYRGGEGGLVLDLG